MQNPGDFGDPNKEIDDEDIRLALEDLIKTEGPTGDLLLILNNTKNGKEIFKKILDEKNKQKIPLFLNAIDAKKMDFAQILVQYGADPYLCEESGIPSLLDAVHESNESLLKFLLGDLHLDPNKLFEGIIDKEVSAFYYALCKRNLKIIELFFKFKADVNQKINGEPIVFEICTNKDENNGEILEKLCQSGLDLEAEDTDGFTAIMRAACNGRSELVATLIKYGANVNHTSKNKSGTIAAQATALMSASVFGHVAVINVLANKGADLEAKDADGKTALVHALENKQFLAAKALISWGAKITDDAKKLINETVKWTPAEIKEFRTLRINNDEKMKEDFEKSKKMQENVQSQAPASSLENFGNNIIQKYLKGDKSAWTNSFLKSYHSPLTWAIKYSDSNTILKLIQAGEDVNEMDKSGDTPLTLAAQRSGVLTLKYLLDAKADINKTNLAGKTPLVVAIQHSTTNGQYLIKAGADVFKKVNNYPPLTYALCPFNEPIIQALGDEGVDLNLVDCVSDHPQSLTDLPVAKPAPKNDPLFVLGTNLVNKVRSELFIGRSNVAADLIKTGKWSDIAVDSVRKELEWKKVNDAANKSKWQTHFTSEKLLPGITGRAGEAARAYYSKAGNCGEIVSYSMYLLCLYFKKHPEYSEALRNDEISLTKITLPVELDHTFLELKIKNKTIYIDPWLGSCFNPDEFEEMRKKMSEMLVREYFLGIDKADYQRKCEDNFPKNLASRQELLERYANTQLAKIYYNKIHGFRTKYTPSAVAPDPNTPSLKTDADFTSFIDEFQKEWLTLVKAEPKKMDDKLKKALVHSTELKSLKLWQEKVLKKEKERHLRTPPSPEKKHPGKHKPHG